MRAVIYSRISDDRTGREAGVKRQTSECLALAKARGATVIDTIVDNDVSATSGKRRPGYERVLDLIREGAIDSVVVWHTDRLYRLPRDLEPLVDLTESHSLKFLTVTASDIDLNTASGRMTARILASVSANEVEHKVERQRAGSDQRARNGAPTSRPGYGLQRDGDRVVEIPEEAEVLRESARRVLAGESMRSIAADLNARGVPSPSGIPWQGVSVRRALQRPSIAGFRVHRGQIMRDVAANGDVILDRDTWDRLNALFADPLRKPNRRGRGPQHLLSGIAVCGACGAPVYQTPGWTPKPDSRSKRTVAPGYACKECCGVRRKQDHVDFLVTEVLLRRLERPDAIELFRPRNDMNVATTRSEIEAIDARLQIAADSFAEGSIDVTQLTRITAKLREKREAFEADLRQAMPPIVPVEAVGERAREAWADMGLDQQRALVDALVEVTILPVGAGRRVFDPESVKIEWREDER